MGFPVPAASFFGRLLCVLRQGERVRCWYSEISRIRLRGSFLVSVNCEMSFSSCVRFFAYRRVNTGVARS